VTDDCGNAAVPVVIRVSRMYDETLPVIQDQDDVVLEGCNAPWPSEFTTTWSDNCSEGGTISGVADTVMIGLDGCSQYIDYTFNVTDDCGNAAVPVVIRVSRMYDETLPVIQDQDDVVLEGCNAPWPSEFTTTWSDNCSEGGTILGVAGAVMTGLDGCSQYIDYTFNVTDDCGNAAVPVVIRITRQYDETLPVIQDQEDVVLEGCNAPWPSEVTTTWSDNCSEGGTISGVAGAVMLGLDGCSQYIDYTFNATDDCGNAAVPVVIRVSRMYDETLPVIQDQDDVVLDGCNTPWPSEFTTTWSDNCSEGGTISGVAGAVMTGLDGCSQYIDYTFNVTDDCGNTAVPVVIRVSRMYDETLPVIQDQDDVVLDGCNALWPSEFTTTWSDNCSEGGTISGVAGTVMLGLDGCSQYIDYTFNITDDCGNAAVPVVIRVSRMYDETLPVIQDQDDVVLDGCNAPWPSEFTTTWSDNCSEGGTISGVAGTVMTGLDGCSQYIDYTFNVTDDCGNTAVPVVIRVSRMYDETLPVIQDQEDVVLEGCNAPWPSEVTTTWSDNCSEGGTILGVAGTVMLGLDGCCQYIDYTFNATDDCGNTAVPVVIRVSRMYDETPPEINCPSDMEVFDCNEVPYIEIPVATDNCDQDVTVTATRSDGLALNDPFPIGELVTITFTAEDNCYNEASCSFTVLVNSCDAPHCTYTQGFYGNVNGTACLPDGGSTMAQDIMAAALVNVGGEYNFGSLATGNYFLLKLTDINRNHIPAQNNIFKMMPGGGTPRQLIGFATYDIFATWADNDPLNASGKKKGKINNNLLSQTITLFFNLQMDNGLGSYELTNTFATVDVECGTDTPIPDSTQIFNVSQNVIDYLEWNGGATVSNLFILANKALGGENIGSLSHSEVEQAVDAINKGFDTCRMQVPVPVEESVDLSDSLLKADFIVYPVPFKDYFTIQYQFRYQSDVEIQVFDARGVLLMTAHDKGATYGKEIRVNTTFNLAGRDAFYYVKVISRTGVSIKKIVSVSR
jgi:c-di-GMP-binding flagellar brake protein YcgR